MTPARGPARPLIPLDRVVRRYQREYSGQGGVLYLPRSDWRRVWADSGDGSAFAGTGEAERLATLAGVLAGATGGVIADVRLIPDAFGPARILPNFAR